MHVQDISRCSSSESLSTSETPESEIPFFKLHCCREPACELAAVLRQESLGPFFTPLDPGVSWKIASSKHLWKPFNIYMLKRILLYSNQNLSFFPLPIVILTWWILVDFSTPSVTGLRWLNPLKLPSWDNIFTLKIVMPCCMPFCPSCPPPLWANCRVTLKLGKWTLNSTWVQLMFTCDCYNPPIPGSIIVT